MSKDEALAKIRAAAWQAAAEIDWREAVKMLQQVVAEIQQAQWSGSNNR